MTQHADQVDAAVADARARFTSSFHPTCDRLALLLDQVAAGDGAARSHCVDVLHRMAGLGGSIGFATVSTQARALEDMLRDSAPGPVDLTVMRRHLDGVRHALDQDRRT
jgi:Hpt domain